MYLGYALRKMARELGLEVKDGVVCGIFKRYAVSMWEGLSGTKTLSISAKFDDKLYEKLDKDLQDILVDTAKEFDEWTFTEVSAEEKEAAEKMKEDGVTINDQVDIEAFKEASESIYSTYEGWSDDLVEKCQKTLAEIRGE